MSVQFFLKSIYICRGLLDKDCIDSVTLSKSFPILVYNYFPKTNLKFNSIIIIKRFKIDSVETMKNKKPFELHNNNINNNNTLCNDVE